MITEQSTDYMYGLDKNNHLILRKFKGKVCLDVFSNEDFQIFYTEIGNYLYNKKEEKVYELSWDSWFKLIMKVEQVTGYGKNIKSVRNEQDPKHMA